MLSHNEREDWRQALALYDKMTAGPYTRPDGVRPSVWICELFKAANELEVAMHRRFEMSNSVDVAMNQILVQVRPGIAAVFLPHMYLDAYGFNALRTGAEALQTPPDINMWHRINTEIRRLWLQERVDGHAVRKLLTREQIEACIRMHTNEGELT